METAAVRKSFSWAILSCGERRTPWAQEGAFAQRNQEGADRVAPFQLLVGEILTRAVTTQEAELGGFDHEFEELPLLLGERRKNFLLLVFPLFSLLVDRSEDRESADPEAARAGHSVLPTLRNFRFHKLDEIKIEVNGYAGFPVAERNDLLFACNPDNWRISSSGR